MYKFRYPDQSIRDQCTYADRTDDCSESNDWSEYEMNLLETVTCESVRSTEISKCFRRFIFNQVSSLMLSACLREKEV